MRSEYQLPKLVPQVLFATFGSKARVVTQSTTGVEKVQLGPAAAAIFPAWPAQAPEAGEVTKYVPEGVPEGGAPWAPLRVPLVDSGSIAIIQYL